MKRGMKLFLVGYMGCGKSTFGRKLARHLGWPLVDTDHTIERREGITVGDIFHYAGENYFRKQERDLLEELIADPGSLIVSTGGGLPIYGDNMQRMNECGVTVYLARSAESIASRLSPFGRQKRPKLRGLNDEELLKFMQQEITERAPRYAEAHLCLEADTLSDEEMMIRIEQFLARL